MYAVSFWSGRRGESWPWAGAGRTLGSSCRRRRRRRRRVLALSIDFISAAHHDLQASSGNPEVGSAASSVASPSRRTDTVFFASSIFLPSHSACALKRFSSSSTPTPISFVSPVVMLNATSGTEPPGSCRVRRQLHWRGRGSQENAPRRPR